MTAKDISDTEGLSPSERKELERIKKDGCLLVSPNYRPTKTITQLLQKARIREISGLLDGVPQGYVPND